MNSWRTPNPHKLVRGMEIVSIEPLKIFDNLSFMTNTFVGCFLLETSDGLMMLDTMYARDHDYQVESIRKLGYDPKDIRKILITHGHGDHFDGAQKMKELTGATVYMSKIDEAFAQDMANVKPGRQPMPDIVDEYLEDGGAVTLGDTSVKTYFTPGHTPGCMSFILPVYDEGRCHTASLWGGTGLNVQRKNNEILLESCIRFSEICLKEGVDVAISTHPFVDNSIERMEVMRKIVDGVPNPFVLGYEGYHRFEQMYIDMYKRSLEEKAE